MVVRPSRITRGGPTPNPHPDRRVLKRCGGGPTAASITASLIRHSTSGRVVAARRRTVLGGHSASCSCHDGRAVGYVHEGRASSPSTVHGSRGRRVVKPNGNILVFGTSSQHLPARPYPAARARPADPEFRHLVKPNAQPNITARTLTESTEQIIWAVNGTPAKATGWTFNYWDAKEMNGGKQLRNVWDSPSRRSGAVGGQTSVAETTRRCSSASGPLASHPGNCCSTRSAARARSVLRRRSTGGVAVDRERGRVRGHRAAPHRGAGRRLVTWRRRPVRRRRPSTTRPGRRTHRRAAIPVSRAGGIDRLPPLRRRASARRWR